MGRAVTTPQEIDQILSLRAEGKTIEQIVQAVGRSRPTVHRILAGYRPQGRRGLSKGSWLPPEQVRDRILQGHAKGYSLGYLSRQYQVPYRRLLEFLPHSPMVGRRGLSKLQSVEQEVITEYQQTSADTKEIAKRFGVRESTLQAFLYMRGLLKAKDEENQSPGLLSENRQSTKERYWSIKVVETSLKQKLPKDVVVYHMNENHGDNTLSNLWLFPNAARCRRYRQQLLASLQQGGQLSPSLLARGNGGLWLLETLDRLSDEPDTDLQSLFDS